MSNEQEDIYIVDQPTFTFIMFASVLGALVLSFVIFVVQLVVEGQQRQRDSRAAKARRLRLKANDREVHAPSIPSGHFHLFLSHVWDTGQDQMRIIKQRLLEMIPELCVFLGTRLVRSNP
jgi:hypothetical protein